MSESHLQDISLRSHPASGLSLTATPPLTNVMIGNSVQPCMNGTPSM